MNNLKHILYKVKKRIKEWFKSVPFEVHQEALTTIEDMTKTIEELTKQNELLERSLKQRDREIKYMQEERRIDQEFIADLLSQVLRYTDIPSKKIKALENAVTEAKALARKNY